MINLGAGLDTTFYRIDNGSIRWYDLDLPSIIALRKQLLPETDRTHAIAKSLLDASWYDEVTHTKHGVFAIAGGVLALLEEWQVRAFFSALADHLPGAELVFTAYSPVRGVTGQYGGVPGTTWHDSRSDEVGARRRVQLKP